MVVDVLPVRLDLLPWGTLDIFQYDQGRPIGFCVPDDGPKSPSRLTFIIKCFSFVIQIREVHARKTGNQDIRILGNLFQRPIRSLASAIELGLNNRK